MTQSPFIVKIQSLSGNPQVTKPLSMGLGTSEAIRFYSSNFSKSQPEAGGHDLIFKEWQGGLIDGDGSLLVSKKGFASLEITKDLRDEHALNIIKQRYGGSVKLRSGVKAKRYRLHNKAGLSNLIGDINGLIRNPVRIAQQQIICNLYQIPVLIPLPLNYYNGWLSGLLDSDGTVTKNKTTNQIAISVSQKHRYIQDLLVTQYKGNVYIDRSKYIGFKWYISKKEDISSLLDYFKVCPSRSAKKGRQTLISSLYELKELKAHKASLDSTLGKAWNKKTKRFYLYDIGQEE